MPCLIARFCAVRLEGVISKNRSFLIDPVYHNIQVAIVIEIRVDGPVRPGSLLKPPCVGLIVEGHVASVSEHLVFGLGLRHVGNQLKLFLIELIAPVRLAQRAQCGNVIEIVGTCGNSVGDPDIVVPVQIVIGHQHRPAPVGSCDARGKRDFGKDGLAGCIKATMVLQRVAVVFLPEAKRALGFIDGNRVRRSGGCELESVPGHHVQG